MALVNTRRAVAEQRTFSKRLLDAARECARLSHLKHFFEDRHDAAKTVLFAAVEAEPGVVVGPGNSLGKKQGFELGSIQRNEKYTYKLDSDALFDAVKRGKISKADFGALVSGVNSELCAQLFNGDTLPVILTKEQEKDDKGNPLTIDKFVPSTLALAPFIALADDITRVDDEIFAPLLLPDLHVAPKRKKAAAS